MTYFSQNLNLTKIIRKTFVIVILSNTLLYSSTGQALERLSLEKVLSIATENNPEYKRYKTELEQVKLNLKGSYGSFLPTVSLGVDEKKYSSDSQINQTGSSQLSLDANINLFNGFQNKAEIDIAKINIKVAQEQLKVINASLTYSIKKAYYEVLYAKEYLQLLNKIKVRRKQQYDMINLRFQRGRENKGSYLQAQAKYKNSIFEFTQGGRLLETSLQRLSYTLGHSNSLQLTVSGTLKPNKPIVIDLNNLDMIVINIPEYTISSKNVSLASKEKSQANSAFWPRINLTGSVGRNGENFSHLDQSSWNVGINLKMPLFEGGSRFYKSSAAEKNVLSKKRAVENTYNKLKASVTASYNNYKNYLQNIKVQGQFLEASRLRAEVATSKYRSGLTVYTNWDLVQNEFINYEKSRLLSLRNLLLAEIELEKLMGHGDLK